MADSAEQLINNFITEETLDEATAEDMAKAVYTQWESYRNKLSTRLGKIEKAAGGKVPDVLHRLYDDMSGVQSTLKKMGVKR